ncbi:hypothetical protein H2200_008848 [Cladophialophora chaetospira]|uniref:Major facilitator superfamily (MFS) profile domain-containing protein n=1 Tax=Cladophialophora chaetospira TaxID=386627 RepID=A0AA38X545_9EURO|nr:hypothetical protein H2200_008848 [Cladophialophora chaetospira]
MENAPKPDAIENRAASNKSESTRHESHLPLDGGRTAWIQVLGSFLINMNVYGLVNSFGDFQHFYETEYLSSYSSSAISWIGTVQGSLALFTGAIAGPIFDFGHFLLVLRVASIMLAQGVFAGFCAGLMEVPSIALISDYFKKRTGLALGVAVSGAPIGGLVYSVVFRSVLGVAGFAWATRAVGFVVFTTLGIAMIIIKPQDSRRRKERRVSLKMEAFRQAPILCIVLVAFFVWCAMLVPYFVTPAFAVSLGMSSTTSSYLIAVLNGAQFFGRVIPAWISDYSGAANMYLAGELLTGLLGLHWITVSTSGGLVEFLIFIGFISGMLASLGPIIVPYVCRNNEWLGTYLGVVYAAAGLGVLIGNPVALATVGRGGRREDFLGAQLWMSLCAFVGAALFLIPRQEAKKTRLLVAEDGSGVRDSSPWQDLKRVTRTGLNWVWRRREVRN